jgi:hypothetical protein
MYCSASVAGVSPPTMPTAWWAHSCSKVAAQPSANALMFKRPSLIAAMVTHGCRATTLLPFLWTTDLGRDRSVEDRFVAVNGIRENDVSRSRSTVAAVTGALRRDPAIMLSRSLVLFAAIGGDHLRRDQHSGCAATSSG